jgi:hypothetical protein
MTKEKKMKKVIKGELCKLIDQNINPKGIYMGNIKIILEKQGNANHITWKARGQQGQDLWDAWEQV